MANKQYEILNQIGHAGHGVPDGRPMTQEEMDACNDAILAITNGWRSNDGSDYELPGIPKAQTRKALK